MSTALVAIITAVLGMLPSLITQYLSSKGHVEEERNEDIEQGREDLANGNIPAVDARIDKLCSQCNGTGRVKSDEDIAGELSSIYGVAVDGHSDNKDTGTSGKV